MKKKVQKFRKIRQGGVWGNFIAMLFITAMLSLAIIVLVSTFMFYLIRVNALGEYSKIQAIAGLYERGATDQEIDDFFNGDIREFIVKDADGKILRQLCEDTISDKSGQLALKTEMYMTDEPLDVDIDIHRIDDEDIPEDANLDEETGGFLASSDVATVSTTVQVYEDKKLPILQTADAGLIIPVSSLFDKTFTEMMDDQEFVLGHKTVDLPFWIAIDLKDGQEIFYGKALYRLQNDDVIFVIGMLAIVLVLLVLTAIALIVNLIRSIHKQKKLTAVFFTDEVTDGRNWMWFLIRGGAYLRKRRNDKFNFAVLDLVFVNYRSYCMCHSIAKGEQLLKKVDLTVRRFIDRKKEACAHYASANFALLLKYDNKEELEKRVGEIIAALEVIEKEHAFHFHVGIDLLPAGTDEKGRLRKRKKIDIEEEYNNACTARSTLSDNDSSAVAFFDEKLVEEQKWLDTVQEEQRKALEQEEFLVYYQPKCNPVTGELSGAEALIRWDSPKYGFQPPGRFIPIFEKNGFITEIDHYMVSRVARDQKRWLDEGRNCVPVSVNISRAHFAESDLAEQIRDMIDAEGTPHELIELELTESAFFDDKKAIIRTIGKLKEYGFTVSMDDFGSGYSSLNSLKDMPLDVLKLDAEFFRGDNAGERGEIVVKEALRLAKALNMKTVAEGIEVKEQVDFLADQGCDMIQGYFYDKPQPGSDFVDWMDKKTKKTE